jgi:hypothetical protein
VLVVPEQGLNVNAQNRTTRLVSFVRFVCVAQLLGLAAAVPTAVIYMRRAWRAGAAGLPDVDHQYTAIGWAIAAGVAVIGLALLAVGTARFGLPGGHGRTALFTAQIATLIGVSTVNGAISTPWNHHHFYPRLLILMALSNVAVLIAANLPSARAASRKVPIRTDQWNR